MIQKKYSIEIAAEKEKVWFSLWHHDNYAKWTQVFCEGSNVVHNNWEQGTRVHFLALDGNGMYSTILTNQPNEKMVFEHIGNLHNFEEQPIDEESAAWTGAKESYELEVVPNGVVLHAVVDIYEPYLDFFDTSFPKGLEKVKEMAENFIIETHIVINAPLEVVWKHWISPTSIVQWNTASDDWHTPFAENDCKTGGKFRYRMEQKADGVGFDWEGFYDEVVWENSIKYHMEDGRKVSVLFTTLEGKTHIQQKFEPEFIHSFEMQYMGWQAIMDSFGSFITTI